MAVHTPVLETPRLYLRKITLEDTDSLQLLFEDPVAMQYFPGTKDRAETGEWIHTMRSRYESDGMGFYACILKDTEEFIGYCGLLLQKDVDGTDETEVGYGLIRKYWHQGYATEAAKACMEHAFNHLGAKSIISLIRPENINSINVARRNHLTFVKNVVRFGHPHRVYGAKSPL
ncbi:MAG: GNAT family N-acetyltransferase [Proteobacteria bacterium]|nr:GNAT family N-acetyltransferase [Pseudomonadota bacterium]MBU4055256.1 GNAT family N-acetyltransferase [Pseudomonadota bacterium]